MTHDETSQLKELKISNQKLSDRVSRLTRMVNDLTDRLDKREQVIDSLVEESRLASLELATIIGRLDAPTETLGRERDQHLSRMTATLTRDDLIDAVRGELPTLPLSYRFLSPTITREELISLYYLKIYPYNRHPSGNITSKKDLMQAIYGVKAGYSAHKKIDPKTRETLSDRFDRLVVALDQVFGIDKAQEQVSRLTKAQEDSEKKDREAIAEQERLRQVHNDLIVRVLKTKEEQDKYLLP